MEKIPVKLCPRRPGDATEATIKMDKFGSFHLKTLGKSSILLVEGLLKKDNDVAETIINIWYNQVSRKKFLEFAAYDLQINQMYGGHTKNGRRIPYRWTDGDILIAGERFKGTKKNVFTAFCFNNNMPTLLFYFCENDRYPTEETFFKGLRLFLEYSKDQRSELASLVCQPRFCFKGKLRYQSQHIDIIKDDIMAMLNQGDGRWSIAEQNHNQKIKNIWPWIDSYIVGVQCFL